ncbi:hypothetical protein KKG41_01565 [Patescibacteria group bacterium]|nr:hypothetical protein [Patescibacteria group bacterium]
MNFIDEEVIKMKYSGFWKTIAGTGYIKSNVNLEEVEKELVKIGREIVRFKHIWCDWIILKSDGTIAKKGFEG